MILNKKDMLRVLTTRKPAYPHVMVVKVCIKIEDSFDINLLAQLDVEPNQLGMAIIDNDLIQSIVFTSHHNGMVLVLESFSSKETTNTIDDYYESLK